MVDLTDYDPEDVEAYLVIDGVRYTLLGVVEAPSAFHTTIEDRDFMKPINGTMTISVSMDSFEESQRNIKDSRPYYRKERW